MALNKKQKEAKTLDFGSTVRKAQSGDVLALGQLKELTANDIDYNKDYGKLNVKDLQWLYNNVPNLKGITDQAFEDYAIRNHITKDEAVNGTADIADAMKAASAENRVEQADKASKADDKWNPVNVPGSGNKKQVAQGNLTEDRPLTKAEERRAYDSSITDEESKDVDALQNATENIKTGGATATTGENKPAVNNGNASAPVNTNGEKAAAENIEDVDFGLGKDVEDAPEDNEKLKQFWNKFRAGSLRAYPWLQTIADAIGKNARMTQDRAAILTGGQRDPEAYDTVKPEEHITDDYKIEQAYADARAGNLDSVKKLLMSGDVTIENVAAALNMSEEDAKKVFGNFMVKDTAEAKTAETNAKQAEAQLMTTYLQNETTVQNNINFIDEKIREIDTAINQLQSNDYDTYLKVYGEYVNIVRGIENTGIASTNTNDTSAGGSAHGGGKIGGVVDVGADANFSKNWGSSNTSTGSTDVLAKQALPKAEYMAQSAMGERNAANNELIEKLKAQRAQLQQARDLWQQTMNDAIAQRKGTTTKLNYKPNTQEATTQGATTQGAE
jgi:hypothetical protein